MMTMKEVNTIHSLLITARQNIEEKLRADQSIRNFELVVSINSYVTCTKYLGRSKF